MLVLWFRYPIRVLEVVDTVQESRLLLRVRTIQVKRFGFLVADGVRPRIVQGGLGVSGQGGVGRDHWRLLRLRSVGELIPERLRLLQEVLVLHLQVLQSVSKQPGKQIRFIEIPRRLEVHHG